MQKTPKPHISAHLLHSPRPDSWSDPGSSILDLPLSSSETGKKSSFSVSSISSPGFSYSHTVYTHCLLVLPSSSAVTGNVPPQTSVSCHWNEQTQSILIRSNCLRKKTHRELHPDKSTCTLKQKGSCIMLTLRPQAGILVASFRSKHHS